MLKAPRTFVDLVAALGLDHTFEPAALLQWLEATQDLVQRPEHLDVLRTAWQWLQLGQGLPSLSDEEAARRVSAETCCGARQARWLLQELPPLQSAEGVFAFARRTQRLRALEELGDIDLLDTVYQSSRDALACVDALRDEGPISARLADIAPQLCGLAWTADHLAAVEHERGPDTATSPLIGHLSRVIGRKLIGLEEGDLQRFQRTPTLSFEGFDREVQRVDSLRADGVLIAVRVALLHLDFAKGGSAQQRARWQDAGIDLAVHNLAARQILCQRAEGPFGPTRKLTPTLTSLALALIESHGLAGQMVRGETTLSLFAPFAAWLRHGALRLGRALELPLGSAIDIACDALHVVNVCDTAGVREGLLDDPLVSSLRAVLDSVRDVASQAFSAADLEADPHTVALQEVSVPLVERELQRHDRARWNEQLPHLTAVERARERLSQRLMQLRQSRRATGEPADACREVYQALPTAVVATLDTLMSNAQFWYAEAATAALSAGAQLRIFALALGQAANTVDTSRPYHVSFQPLLADIVAQADGAAGYRVRLIEALLNPIPVASLLELGADAIAQVGDTPLATFVAQMGTSTGVAVGFEESEEADALLTLLPIYERKSSAAFHATLKTLCDLYGLRKDEFDRVANEAMYLVTMNAARSDKARMLDHVVPGTIVEVGPGGGVVLDLLEQRYPESRVVGIDVSHMVVEALQKKKEDESRRWEVIEGDAYEMPAIMGESSVDTIVFCSVLHEIYSYVEWPTRTGVRRRYQLAAVRELLRASYQTLKPGGRLIIRDGVAPPSEVRLLRFLDPGGLEFLQLFAAQFEGRPIAYDVLDDGTVRMDSADAMEFLYCYTWGAESFPYEVREQYGVLTYDAYRDQILEWLGDVEVHGGYPPRWIALPAAECSYLQPGYPANLADKVVLTDASGRSVPLPDSNCLLVFEKDLG